MVQFLLENNASVSALYNSPLFGAIDMGHDDIVLMLLAAGADPNIPMNGIAGGRSPLQASVLQGRLALVEPLINYGANVQYQNNAAKRDAIRRNLWDIVAILEKAEVLSRSQSFV
ncbi:hypothetical protein BDR26DRAFT_873777 [Obelidium mucronatum]|nr:hypothetical protein BDR26DRAFT_873777 [Obelidium mucronatum]